MFGWVLNFVVEELQDQFPQYSTVDPVFLAARGAFELAKRFNYRKEHGSRQVSDEIGYQPV